MDGAVRVVRVVTGQGGQVGQVVGCWDQLANIMCFQKIKGFTCPFH